ncbi:MAG: PilZ domain-containing protein [Candidatus Sulfotelmatobacter sp.]
MTAPTRKPVADPRDRRRRRHTRYRADFRVTASHLAANQYQKFEGNSSDLSEAGIGMLLPTDLNSGEVVGLRFSLPGSTLAWELRAVVRYRRGYHYGFEFLSLTGEQREVLKTYLATLEALD